MIGARRFQREITGRHCVRDRRLDHGAELWGPAPVSRNPPRFLRNSKTPPRPPGRHRASDPGAGLSWQSRARCTSSFLARRQWLGPCLGARLAPERADRLIGA